MSRVIGRDKSQERKPDDAPGVSLLPEDSSDVMDAIEELSSSMSELGKKIEAMAAKDDNAKALRAIVDAIAAANRTLIERVAGMSAKKNYRLKIVRDEYGDLHHIDAEQVDK